MAVKVEMLYSSGYPHDLGFISPDGIHPFTNYGQKGEKELIVFRCNREGTSTEIFKAKEWAEEVDLKDLDNPDKFVLQTTLKPGDDFYINAAKNSQDGNPKAIHFMQDDKPLPPVLTRLMSYHNSQKLN